jgi:hypothetical protein
MNIFLPISLCLVTDFIDHIYFIYISMYILYIYYMYIYNIYIIYVYILYILYMYIYYIYIYPCVKTMLRIVQALFTFATLQRYTHITSSSRQRKHSKRHSPFSVPVGDSFQDPLPQDTRIHDTQILFLY